MELHFTKYQIKDAGNWEKDVGNREKRKKNSK